jgi:hypothetical protein
MYGRFRSRRVRRILFAALALIVVLLMGWLGYSRLAELSREREDERTMRAFLRTIYPDTPSVPSILRPDLIPTAESLMRQPAPAPDFAFVGPFPGKVGPAERICVDLLPGRFWEPGDESEELSPHLAKNTKLLLDGQPISPAYRESFVWTGPGIRKSDGKGNLIGSHGGSVAGCFSVNLALGLHIATIQVLSTSGVLYSYTWAFRVNSTDAGDYARMKTATSQARETHDAAFSTAYSATGTAEEIPPFDVTRIVREIATGTAYNATYNAKRATEVAGYPGTIAARTSTAQGTPNPSSGRTTQ